MEHSPIEIAREYGFSRWSKLKQHAESRQREPDDPSVAFQAFKEADLAGDAERAGRLLQRHPSLKAEIDAPVFSFDAPAIVVSKSNRAMVDVLLVHGADINARSRWWAGGFGVLDGVDAETGAYLISRGANVDVHAAAGLGMLDRLKEMIDADPSLVNAKGGDGQRPLHFARAPEIIDFLLDHGAEIDARDVDHEGTPAQWAVPPFPAESGKGVSEAETEKCRHLIRRGAEVDIFMACALGDVELVREVLANDPQSVTARIGDGSYRPVPNAPGGHIYTYTLAANASPHQIAATFGHDDVYALLLKHSPVKERFLAACARPDEEAVRALLAEHPAIVSSLSSKEARQLVDAAWRNEADAVRVMLIAGFDPHVVGDDEMTPLHSAAFHGFADIVELLLAYDPDPPLEAQNAFGGTPLSTCIYGSMHSWRRDGHHAAAAEALIAAGAHLPEQVSGSPAVAAVLRRHGVKDVNNLD